MAKEYPKKILQLENGEEVEAIFPVIVSASRSTDIPAFYAEWFFQRLKKGYSVWRNPFNGKKSYIGYKDTKFIIFWSKNPRPLIRYMDYLAEQDIGYYIHYTLNDYERERLEPAVPPLDYRLKTFQELAQLSGRNGVIWRFDPLILTEHITPEILLARIRHLASHLYPYTERLVFSFADIGRYKKVKNNLDKKHVIYHEWNLDQMQEFAQRLVELNHEEGWNLKLATCGEIAELAGIEHNKCIDEYLILRRCASPAQMAQFLGMEIIQNSLIESSDSIARGNVIHGQVLKNQKDKGQRNECKCIKSKDIGEYDTCIHLCEYCYAISNQERARKNYLRHCENGELATISGN